MAAQNYLICPTVPRLLLNKEFFLYQKLWHLLEYREKVDKSDTKWWKVGTHWYGIRSVFPQSIWCSYRLNRKKGSFISIFYIMFKIKTQVKIQNRRWYRAGKLGLMLYILTSVWVLRNPNAGWNLHSKRFCAKKLKKAKKQEICIQFFGKNWVF